MDFGRSFLWNSGVTSELSAKNKYPSEMLPQWMSIDKRSTVWLETDEQEGYSELPINESFDKTQSLPQQNLPVLGGGLELAREEEGVQGWIPRCWVWMDNWRGVYFNKNSLKG